MIWGVAAMLCVWLLIALICARLYLATDDTASRLGVAAVAALWPLVLVWMIVVVAIELATFYLPKNGRKP